MEKLAAAPGGGWTARAGAGVVRTLGTLEILAAVGLVLPALVGIAPVLVPVTGVCWILLMIGAMVTHVRLGEAEFATLNVVHLALAVFVVWGRFGPEAFAG
jgi:hypothetical protein